MPLTLLAQYVPISNPETFFEHLKRPLFMIGCRYARQLTCNQERDVKGTVRHDTSLRAKYSRRAGSQSCHPTTFCMQPGVVSI